MSVHIVPENVVTPGRTYGEVVEGGVALETTDYVLRVKSKHQSNRLTDFSLIFRNAALGTRLVYQGPIVHEDVALMIAQATVISRHAFAQPTRVEAQVGDYVVFAGHVWVIREDKALHDPYLALVG